MRNILIYVGILITTTFLISCDFESSNNRLKHKLTSIDSSSLIYKIGDCLFIKDSNNFYATIILGFNKDSTGIYYGMCFTNYRDTIKPNINTLSNSRLFGRQIPHGLINTKCVDCFDLVYLSENGLRQNVDRYGLIQNIQLDKGKIKVGSETPASSMTDVIQAYNFGIQQRKKKPDECKESKYKAGAITERYFTLDMLK